MAFLRKSTSFKCSLVTILKLVEGVQTNAAGTPIEVDRVSDSTAERNSPSRDELYQEGDSVWGLNIVPFDAVAIVRGLEDAKRRQLWPF